MTEKNPSWEYDILCKVIIVGDTGVGKSCLLTMYSDNYFSNQHTATIGVDFKLKTQKILEKKVKIQIWDSAGQERFRTITGSYYRGANGVLLVFDCTNEESFRNVPNWIDEIKKLSSPNVKMVLVCNKADLKDRRVISTEEASKFAQEHNIPYIETSAKAAFHVEEVFLKLVTSVIESRNYLENPTKETTLKGMTKETPNDGWCQC
jgi:Ras-related protein Rab-1A